jgi:hypothetical protein
MKASPPFVATAVLSPEEEPEEPAVLLLSFVAELLEYRIS